MSEGRLVSTIRLTHGSKDNEKSKGYRMEETFPIKGLRTDTVEEEVRVTQAVSTKVSDAVYYGEGTWDKIPYAVEIFSSVSVVCDQTPEKVLEAQNVAHQMAFESSHGALQKALIGHVNNIQTNLYSGYFDES